MLAHLEHELIEDHGWLTRDEFLEITAIAQITPGPIAINAATFVGRRMAGIPGSLIASIAVVLPPLMIVGFLAGYLTDWIKVPEFQKALMASRYAVAALIIHASCRMLILSVTSLTGRILFIAALATLLLTPVHPLIIILLGAAVGLLLKLCHRLPEEVTKP